MPRSGADPVGSVDGFPRRSDEPVELAYLLRICAERWRVIGGLVGLALVSTFLLTEFFMPKWYRAVAILRPVPRSKAQVQLAEVLGGPGGGVGVLRGALGNDASDEAEEYMTILRSYAFTSALLERCQLYPRFLAELNGTRASKPSWQERWKVYRLIADDRFDCDYSLKTGNLTLWFLDRNPAEAGRILSYYVDGLREKVRSEEAQEASAAIASLEAEAKVTPDALLQTQLYELIAKQVEKKKLAQVEADFAFRTLEPPIVSYKPYRPHVAVDTMTAGLIVLTLTLLTVVGRERLAAKPSQDNLSDHGNGAATDLDSARPQEHSIA